MVPGLVTGSAAAVAVAFADVVVAALVGVVAAGSEEDTDDDADDEASDDMLSDDEAPSDDEATSDEATSEEEALSDNEPLSDDALSAGEACDRVAGAELTDAAVDGAAAALVLLAVVPGVATPAESLLLHALTPTASDATPHNAHRRTGPADHVFTKFPCCRHPTDEPGLYAP